MLHKDVTDRRSIFQECASSMRKTLQQTTATKQREWERKTKALAGGREKKDFPRFPTVTNPVQRKTPEVFAARFFFGVT